MSSNYIIHIKPLIGLTLPHFVPAPIQENDFQQVLLLYLCLKGMIPVVVVIAYIVEYLIVFADHHKNIYQGGTS
jgi:hypothetical protein